MKISAPQLAFLLDIKKGDAREKIVFAYCKEFNKEIPQREATQKYEDYPSELEAAIIAKHCNLPMLEYSLKDINENYLKRQSTKKYILFDYPEAEIKSRIKQGKNNKLSIPSVLKSLLSSESINAIREHWKEKYPKYV